jgi:hypothetical protein
LDSDHGLDLMILLKETLFSILFSAHKYSITGTDYSMKEKLQLSFQKLKLMRADKLKYSKIG